MLTRPGKAGEHFAWPVRATSGITAALGLQLVAGPGLDAAGAPRLPDGATPVLLTRSAAEQIYGTTDDAIGQAVERQRFRARPRGGRREGLRLPGRLDARRRCRSWSIPAEPVTEHEIIYVMRAPAGRRDAVDRGGEARARAGVADADSAVVVRALDESTTRLAIDLATAR